jgi:hypothetical protein
MSVTFRAKSGITTSNPTEFTVTAEGLANSDASITFDDITVPIVKNVTVEPEYVDYTLNLVHTGDIIKGEEKEMTLSYSSSMGRYYEHARLIAEATTPSGGTVQLMGQDQLQLKHDIIQSGWGDAQGFKIGGKDVSQDLNVSGLFSEAGNYSITLKLIDRDNSDSIIAEKTFNFEVLEKSTTNPSTDENTTNNVSNQTENTTNITNTTNTSNTQENQTEQAAQNTTTKTTLLKTGNNIYVQIAVISIFVLCIFAYFNKEK